MILSDREITENAIDNEMINPFCGHQVNDGVISYGVTSYGYDMRLGATLRVFGYTSITPHTVIDPKHFDESLLTTVHTMTYYDLPPYTYALGHSVEHFAIPTDVSALVIGKSTYARCGLIVNCTPMEPGWRGHLTIELFNATDIPLRLYIGEGICQAQFFRGETPMVTYADRRGKYQEQQATPVTAKVMHNES